MLTYTADRLLCLQGPELNPRRRSHGWPVCSDVISCTLQCDMKWCFVPC